MEKRVAWNTGISVFKILFWRIYNGKRFHVNGLESFDKGTLISIEQKGFMNFGKHCVTRRNVTFRSYANLEIGDKVFINENTLITCMKHISIGANTEIGNGVTIVDHDHDYKHDMKKFCMEDIVIGENSWIGANAVILRGTKLGRHCVVGAGSLVKGQYPDFTIVAGSPAKIVGVINQEEMKEKSGVL